MKICLLSDCSNTHTIKLCKYLVDGGHRVYVISLTEGEIEGTVVYSFDQKNTRTRSDLSKLKYLLKLNKIKKIIREIEPDILNAHYATSYGLIAGLIGFHPFILSVWGSDVYMFPNKSFVHKALLKFVLGRADKILSTSRALMNETRKYTAKAIEITPFGVDLNKFRPSGRPVRENAAVKIGTAKTLGRIYGIDYLIKAFGIAKNSSDIKAKIELHIAGDGECRNELTALARDLSLSDVFFLGRLSADEMPSFYNDIDIAVMPSLFESFGVSAVEAQACALPVIVTDIEGLKESTSPGESSLVVESKNEHQLAQAIITLVNNAPLRKKMGDAGAEYVRRSFDINDNFERIISIYKSVLQ